MKAPILLLLFLAPVLSAQTAFPSLDADPRAAGFVRGVSSGARNAWQDLARAALWASSVNSGAAQEERAAGFYERVSAAAAELAAAPDLPSDPRARGEYVLTFIHRRFLKGYSEYQTRLDEIFVSGRYNCVSSAVLYLVLGMSAGLDIGGVMTKDHAFASVRTGGASIDVETTNPYGFDPGNRKDFHDGFGRTTGYAYVPARNYRDRAAINAVELVSLILSNRIADLERANRYAEAVPLAINRAALLNADSGAGASPPSNADRAAFFEDPRQDMMNRLFNYGAYLVRANRDDEAIAWAEYAGARYEDGERWQEFVYAAANNKLVRLIRARKISEARAALETLRPKLSDPNYRACDSMVLEAETADMVNGIKNPGDSQRALAFIEANGERLPEKIRTDFRDGAVLKEGERIGRTGDWRGAMNWMSASIERYGANSPFNSALRTFRQNVIGSLHNQFAALFNKRDYAGAKASVQKSLEEFPADAQLIRDLNMVNRVLEQSR
ncbi:MAG: hypothetical protein LBB82_02405 [Treponema sp.]|jgi:hypothetical protein|nr:hypothetical protein [Treponema sp.]